MTFRTTIGRILGLKLEAANEHLKPFPTRTDVPARATPPYHERQSSLRAANERTIERLKNMTGKPALPEDPARRAIEENRGGVLEPGNAWMDLPERPGYAMRQDSPGYWSYRTPGGIVRDGFSSPADAGHAISREVEGNRHHAAKVDRAILGAAYAKHFLIFLNGDPRSGKDTTSAFLVEAFRSRGYKAEMHSSIEPVRQMILKAGIDVSAKTEKDRRLLAEIGDLTEAHCGFRSNYCVGHFLKLVEEADQGVALVLHTREPHTMHKIAFLCRQVANLRVETLFISGRGASVETNRADAGVRGMIYDTTIANDGTIKELDLKCTAYVESLTR